MPAKPQITPNVFNIPASAPFLAVLIDALRSGKLVPGFPASDDPLELSKATIFLPTRRACRLARDVFLDRLKGDAAILPRIVALGDLDEDEIAFAQAASGELAEAALALPEAFGALDRRLTLAELIAKWAATIGPHDGAPLIANTPAAAIALADDLARLMDDMITRQVPWKNLDKLVPGDLDQYWQQSLKFLQFVHPLWRAILKEQNAIESAERRDLLIEAEAKRLATSSAPVIAAGSTGSMPATAKLLATIAGLPHGALVLPGLDIDLDDASWTLIAGNADDKTHDGAPAAGHAQFSMQALLSRIGIARHDVKQLSEPAPHGRELLVSEALRPAASTERWQARTAKKDFIASTERALTSLSMVEAANAEEEALAIAVVLREAVETPNKTAALVTPDRALARRVVSALARWHVEVDDSGGESLADTPAGIFARLAAQAALGGLEPVTLLALLKHPLLRLMQAAGAHNAAIATLEHALLRGPRPRPGSDALGHALSTFRANRDSMHRSDPRWLIEDDAYDVAAELIARLGAALAPLESLKRGSHPLAALAQCHSAVISGLGRDDKGGVAAFAGTDGAALARAFEELSESPAAKSLAVAKSDYAELFHASIGDRVVRRPELHDVRVRVLGPLEARLQAFDRVVLGGLNEATWPPETRSDPWLSRPMRRDLGLDPPERRIGLSAHDFAQSLGAPEVILTRAAKVAGSPTVTSRFVQRIAALAGESWKDVLARGHHYLDLARELDRPAEITPVEQPKPKPPLEARPHKLSVTEIEHWWRDPYTIYAKHVLRLLPIEPVDTPPGARDRGTLIHDAIGDFTKKFAAGLPPQPLKELLAFGKKRFAQFDDYPEAHAFWWPRFERIAQWFVRWEGARRASLTSLHAEIRGEIEIPLGGAKFTLSARADRIERLKDGGYAILDYKTGRLPGHDEVKVGFAPQLTLEAAILREGGFNSVPRNSSIAELVYVGLKGGEPPGEIKLVKLKDSTPDAQADIALERLTRNAKKFLIDGEPYSSLVSPMWKGRRYGDYDHLARVKEWSIGGGEDET
jgi:ATP-dependent helicase/nuclease subunit B